MKPSSDRDPSQELTPRAARRQFLNAKRGNVKDSTHRAYKFPTKHFVQYCENNGVERIGDINNYLLESWVQKRENENVKPITAKQTAKLNRVFIKWCENSGLVEPGTADRIRIPETDERDEVSQETVRRDQAQQVLNTLSTYEYGTRKHVAFRFMWDVGCRASGAIALDIDDLGTNPKNGKPTVQFRDRKQQGTPLKNGKKSERTIMISEDLRNLLQDYIDGRRDRVTDEYGRRPLFTTPTRRVSRQHLYKDTVAFSRPCVYTGFCPDGREIDGCEFAQKKKKAMSCPENFSLHPIRRGSITDHINRGWPKEELSERVDVSVDVLEKHYDARTEQDALERREEFRDLV
ncbi:tyrosine-type recombinase/integrase [Haloterrigena salifodinae]|uniref:Tyrosine-type recombinase/integrase n=1 Tax=Haloterrigena salifodinae TaxID=2675099 RepID=A0A8T8DZI1_9EURY|nr:site-specific integrase [Haloterrigena salifodinae]QRV15004.1 tyrosine-type recombinase/integrase [Haloterrigena salifodinae]